MIAKVDTWIAERITGVFRTKASCGRNTVYVYIYIQYLQKSGPCPGLPLAEQAMTDILSTWRWEIRDGPAKLAEPWSKHMSDEELFVFSILNEERTCCVVTFIKIVTSQSDWNYFTENEQTNSTYLSRVDVCCRYSSSK